MSRAVLPNFDATSFILTVGALILGVALAIAAAGWLVGRVFPALRLLAPFAIAALACWRAALAFPKGDQIGYFVIPFVLAGAAVAVGRVLRAPAEPRLGVGAAARILFIGSAAIYGALHMGPGNVVTGVLGIAAACAVTSIWDAERRAPVARGSGAQRRAIGLSLLALVVAALSAPPVVEGLPEELRMLHAALAIQVAAAAALAGGAALLLVRQARRGRDLLLVEALVVTLSLSGAAARALWWRPGALSRLGQLAVASITFEPPRGWGEVRGSPAPLRLYERNDRKESVTVAPLLHLRGSLFGWCQERDVAVAQALASATFGPAVLRVHRPPPPVDAGPADALLRLGRHDDAYYPCAFQADLESRSARRTVAFRIASCNDGRQLALLHAWSEDWRVAGGATAMGPAQGPGARKEIEQLVQCR